jgi:hypothetical protein
MPIVAADREVVYQMRGHYYRTPNDVHRAVGRVDDGRGRTGAVDNTDLLC